MKSLEFIIETAPVGISYDENIVKKIARLTDNNQHTQALYTGAKMLGLIDSAKTLTQIERDQRTAGHLTQELRALRDAEYNTIMQHAKAWLPEELFSAFHMAY